LSLARMGRGVGLVVGLFLCLVLTFAVFGLPIGDSLRLLAQGAFADKFAVSRTVVKSVPLLVTALGIVVAWRAGMYNVGGEGQFIAGGLAGAWVAKAMAFAPHGAPAPLITFAILVACAVGGGAYGWLAGLLYTRRGVEVVISTILLNFVAQQILGWLVAGPLQERVHQLPETDQLPDAWMLPRIDPQTDFHLGIVIALLSAVALYVYLFRTKAGFELRLVGANARAARANRVPAKRVQERAMMLSGALCGLAGGIEYTAMAGQLGTAFSQNWGFLAIPVALLGGLHPLIVIVSALYFGALFAGSEQLARFTPAGSTLVYIIQAVAVLGFVSLNAWQERRQTRQEGA